MKDLLDFLTGRDFSDLTAEVFVSSKIPYKFKIKALTKEKRAEFQKRCKSPIKKSGTDFDSAKFQTLVCLECCVYPNFADENFISAMGVSTPTEAYNKALLPGEDDELYSQIIKLSGFEEEDINKDIEEARD
ncbi:MAG: phage tail assembly chaperone [Sporomusa sp.]